MDRVLAAERAAQTDIGNCEQEVAGTLERARHERQRLVERAKARIVALHARAADTLQSRAEAAAASRRQSTDAVDGGAANSARRTAALALLAARLTSDIEKSQDVS
jgi:two-component sensor histidine kinase